MRSSRTKPTVGADSKKPGPHNGLSGLLIYGALTILGGLALIAVAE